MNNVKKLRKAIEWESLAISSRNLETPRNIACEHGHKEGQKWYESNKAENVKKRWQEPAEELYKKDPNDPDSHDGVIAHLESDILECEVKGGSFEALLRAKQAEVMEFQLSYLKS